MSLRAPLIGININFAPGGTDPYTLNSAYADAVRLNGGLPLLIPCHADTDLLDGYIGRVDGMLFTGGPDYPPSWYGQEPHGKTVLMEERRSTADRYLVKRILAMGIPVLGICAGCQLLNIAAGGALIQHIPCAEDHVAVGPGTDREHPAAVEPGSHLHRIFNTEKMTVNSAHHQAVDPEQVGKDLKIIARALDGTVEAVQSLTHRFVLGVQWHPERILNTEHRRMLFTHFINECI